MKKTLYILFVVAALAYVAWSVSLLWHNGLLRKTEPLQVAKMELADSAICRAITDGQMHGAVLCVVRRAADGKSMGEVAYLKAYGNRSVLSHDGVADTMAMTTDAVFDIASMSKSVGTTLALMRLVEDGKLRLSDRVDYYIEDFKPWDSIAAPEKRAWGKRRKAAKPRVVKREHITIQHLLTHTSGLPSYINVKEFVECYSSKDSVQSVLRDSLVRHIATQVERRFRPGGGVRYSCLNFVVLQAIIERVAGCGLDEFASREVFEPLGLKNTWYNNLDSAVRPFGAEEPIVPSEQLADGKVLWGEVHDPLARVINRGVSGNAGVFSTAEDLAVVASMLMNGGVISYPEDGWRGRLGWRREQRFYGAATIDRFFRVPESLSEYGRALGWDGSFDKGGCYGDLMSPHGVVSHTGYTGTSMAIDYERGVAVILLTNRVHPCDKGSLGRTRGVVANIVMAALGI
ncbi:MAG: beta-lactamase family protein [Alistipes sp.]|nr:beta-lactamase family protein [Alistipes sp.]